jgi:hypothetical protein
VLAVLVAAGLALALLPARFATETVRWANGAVELAGTLYLPRGAGPHPALVLVPGWGCAERSDPLFRAHGRRLAGEEGIAVLTYDKRGCGESTGEWRRATLAELAEDALAGVELLRGDPRLRADAIGLLGTSLGGTVALLAATRSDDVAFVATLSLSTRSPVEHRHFIVEETLRWKGWPDEVAAAAGELDRRIARTYRTGRGWEEIGAALEGVRDEPWFGDSGLSLHPEPPGTWEWYRDLPMDLENLPLLERLEIPHFAAQGEEDWLVPGPREAEILRAVQRERAKDWSVVTIPGAEHGLRARSRWPLGGWTWPESYWRALGSWLDEKVPRAGGGDSG